MRVVAGEARGRKLLAPVGSTTRPTSDRVRESIFNMLFSLGATEGANVLDLYAGCGALGIEALSRGASTCTFVEQDRRAIDCIHKNVEALGFDERVTIDEADAHAWLKRNHDHYDLVLADPPYAEENWADFLDVIDADWVVTEAGAPLQKHPDWIVVREKNYGTTVVSVLGRRNPDR